MVECEFYISGFEFRCTYCFNRYMVECEYSCFFIYSADIVSFNRYMVECEYKLGIGADAYSKVLIDTWWNVNLLDLRSLPESEMVLIDTWWNVNLAQHQAEYICFAVLIDTWWNVNFICSTMSFSSTKF